jgi:exoribonuclease R
VLAGLDALPKAMADGSRRAGTVERESVGIVEAALLKDRIGDVFEGCVVEVEDRQPTHGTVQLVSPAVIGHIQGPGPLPLGERLSVRLAEADPGTTKILFEPA